MRYQMQFKNNFAALILTHGRPDRVITYSTLRRYGYTGKIIIVIDDQDKAMDSYLEKYGEDVAIFSKKEIAKTFDSADNFSNQGTIIYARNASFDIAEKLGYKYFIQLDDDYVKFDFRFDKALNYRPKMAYNLDKVFDAFVKLIQKTNIKSICMSQGGDFIGGSESGFADKIKFKRKAMNSFVCSVDKKFTFFGRINEDVNTYTRLGNLGDIFLTTNQISLTQKQTQQNSGGMTGVYLTSGTYVKSFYSVMYMPSSVKISRIGNADRRIHHKIKWKNTIPMILRESVKKAI